MKKVFFILFSFLLVIPMSAQKRKPAVKRPLRTTVARPTKIKFRYELQSDGTFDKDGETDYYVLNFGNKSAHQLYMDVLSHIASMYKHPEYVTTKVADRSIIVNGHKEHVAFYTDRDGYATAVSYDYRIELQFKNGKIRVNAPEIVEIQTDNGKWTETYNYDEDRQYYLPPLLVARYILKEKDATEEINEHINSLLYAIVYGMPSNEW